MAGGWGGRRPGAGSKKKDPALRSIDGGANKRGVSKPLPMPRLGDVTALHMDPPPEDLTPAEVAVWVSLAPHALQNRTLTIATSYSFGMLCRNIVLERKLGRHPDTEGSAAHRGILQRVDAELLRFNLSPCGKPMYEPVVEKPANPLERFLKRG